MNEREKLIEAYASGTPSTQLMKDFRIGKGTVLQLISDASVLRRVHTPTREQVDEAERLYVQQHWSLERIGQHLGFAHKTIHNHLGQRGVKMRPPWERPSN